MASIKGKLQNVNEAVTINAAVEVGVQYQLQGNKHLISFSNSVSDDSVTGDWHQEWRSKRPRFTRTF